jgi:hypothetical protein
MEVLYHLHTEAADLCRELGDRHGARRHGRHCGPAFVSMVRDLDRRTGLESASGRLAIARPARQPRRLPARLPPRAAAAPHAPRGRPARGRPRLIGSAAAMPSARCDPGMPAGPARSAWRIVHGFPASKYMLTVLGRRRAGRWLSDDRRMGLLEHAVLAARPCVSELPRELEGARPPIPASTRSTS